MKTHDRIHSTFFRIGCLLIAGLFLLGQIGRVQLNTQIAFNLYDIVLFLLVSYFFVLFRSSIIVFFQKTKDRKILILFFALLAVHTILLSPFHPQQEALISILYLFRFIIYALLFPIIGIAIEKKWIQKSSILFALIFVGCITACIGIVQYVFFPDMRFLYLSGWDDHYYRLVGTFFEPPIIGAILVITAFAIQIQIQKKTAHMILLYIMLFCVLLAVLLTYSRATYLAFFISQIIFALYLKNAVSKIVLICFLCAIPILPRPASEGARLERTTSIVSRQSQLIQTMQSIDVQTVLIGKGWYVRSEINEKNIYPSHARSSDNSFLQIFLSLGVGGLLLFTTWYCVLLYQFRHNPFIFVTVLFLGTASMFNNVFLSSQVLILFWILCAYSASNGAVQNEGSDKKVKR